MGDDDTECRHCRREYEAPKPVPESSTAMKPHIGIVVIVYAVLVLIAALIRVSDDVRNSSFDTILLVHAVVVLLLGLGFLARNRVAKWIFLILFALDILFYIYAGFEMGTATFLNWTLVKLAVYLYVVIALKWNSTRVDVDSPDAA
jgi:hypothetical protein